VSVHLLMSAGRGPQECAWALARLLRRLETDATRHPTASMAGSSPMLYRLQEVHKIEKRKK
jgi:peptide chain release factor